MAHPVEYHIRVRPLIPASLALFGMLLLASTSPAQNNAAASSGSAHSVTATPTASPSSYSAHVSANSGVSSPGKSTPTTKSSRGNNGRPQHTTANPQAPYYFYPYLYAVPVPYPLDISDNGPSEDDPEYQGGPTIFDRRGFGPASYIPPVSASQAQDQAQAPGEDANPDAVTADSNSEPAPPPDPTVLVFKDGHQLEIGNYAIVNQTLYDLTPGHPRKIALADLDLPATEKQNDDHGLTFLLPSSSQAN